MTVRPTFESRRAPVAGTLDGDAVVRAVGAARRRLRTVSTLRLGALAAPGGVVLGAGLALAGWAPWWTPAALAALGAAGAAAWATAHTPTVPTVARILDAHLELRDRVSAALQLRQTGGPVAALVARDAAARLAPVDLTALFPLAIGRGPAVATTMAVALVAWLAAGGVNERGPATAAAGAAEGSASESDDAGARARAGAGTATSEPARQAAGRQTVLETRAPGRGPADAGETPRTASQASSPRPVPTAAPPAAGTQGRPAMGTAGNHLSAPSMASTATGPSGRGAAAGRTTGGAMSSGAGGASGQALAPSPAAGTTPMTSWLNAARTQAEAALARDAIPPDHREHVRAYFRAIGAAPSPGGPR
jgi:hypothetical protein